jgi:uncharacterized membrane protein
MSTDDHPQGAPPPPPPPAETPPPPQAPAGPPSRGSENRTLMLVLSYLGLLALIPLLVEKEDAELQWHAKHGLVLFVLEIGVMLAMTVLSMVASHFMACLGCVVMLGVVIPIIALHVVCIAKALKGERFLIPGISDFADRF